MNRPFYEISLKLDSFDINDVENIFEILDESYYTLKITKLLLLYFKLYLLEHIKDPLDNDIDFWVYPTELLNHKLPFAYDLSEFKPKVINMSFVIDDWWKMNKYLIVAEEERKRKLCEK